MALLVFLMCLVWLNKNSWHHFMWIQSVLYKTKKQVMNNQELEKAATIVGMLLLVTTFIMGILATL